jgi:hypothetical protein
VKLFELPAPGICILAGYDSNSKMRVALFSSYKFEKDFLEEANQDKHILVFLEPQLSPLTVGLAQNCKVVSIFVNDDASQPVLEKLHRIGVRFWLYVPLVITRLI